MHHSEILGIVLACLAVVRAQTPEFNTFITPAAGQDIRAGQNFEIVWKPANAPDGATISIKLLQGQSINAMREGPNVASNIPSSAGHFTWAVPRSIQDDEVYSLKMTLDGNEDIFQNSAIFDIENLDNDDDNRPFVPAPAPNVDPEPPQPPAADPASPEPPVVDPLPPPPQVPGPNPQNPGGGRPNYDDDDDDDRFDNDDDDDDDDDDDRFDDDDDDNRGPRFPGAVPSLPTAPQGASPNAVPKAATNPNKANEIASPAVPPTTPGTKTGISLDSNEINVTTSKLKNGTSTSVTKAESSGAASASSYPKSKITSPAAAASGKPSSGPKPFINSGTASFTTNSLFFILGGITVIFAL